ncbi:nucleotide sugar dehydrogenase [Nocardioides sp. WS12]|uniref:nucleotide sugar dehydrogenase n=1 Tax=Nocardioides sp. WS12 TaxID=2486272 RepID=UPI0015F9DE5D|nr:nucleotide sugar dehydrogenase [Nocardioides sp. WS12]
MDICVVALGKIGLPLAVQFASKGHRVIGADVDKFAVDMVNRGEEPFPGEAHLAEKLREAVDAGLLSATTDTTAAVAAAQAVVIVVPLFVAADGTPSWDWMDAATEAVGRGLKPGTLVSYETTLPIGTTRNRFGPKLEELSGLKAGEDFHLVFSPERVLTGRVFEDLRKYPKLIGGINQASADAAMDFYRAVLDFDDRPDLADANGVWDLGSSEASEFAKLAETTYRDVNIGLANQFARYADQIDVDVLKVIDASNSQPYSHIHRPGIAVGGHCIPIYPRLYLWNDPAATVVTAAREANAGMPSYALDLLAAAHGDLTGVPVLVLGAAYRGAVKETAFSGVFPLVEGLKARGAVPFVSDPMYTDAELEALGLPAHAGEPVTAAIVQADHPEYKKLTPADLPGVTVLVDGRRATDADAWNVEGVRRVVIGG